MRIEELTNQELNENFTYFMIEHLQKGVKIISIAHGSKPHEITCTYSLHGKQFFKSEIIPERLR